MNSYRRGLRNGVLVNPKFFILENVNLGPHTNCWSNLVKRFKNLYYLVRVVTVEVQTGKKVRKLRTDDGQEYRNDQFNFFSKAEGMVRHKIVKATPHQNALA